MSKRLRFLRVGLLVLSMMLIGCGLLRAENRMVLKRAVNICLECIGIG